MTEPDDFKEFEELFAEEEPAAPVVAAPVQDQPLLFERTTAKEIVGGKPRAAVRATAKVVSPQTLRRMVIAQAKGSSKFVDWLYNYYVAADKMDLRLRNPKAHHEITLDRRRRTLYGLGAFAGASLANYVAFGPLGTVSESVIIAGVLTVVGRGGKPILDLKAGEDIGMGETRIQRAVAKAVFSIDLDNEKNANWYKNIIIRKPFREVGQTMTVRLGLPAPHAATKAKAAEVAIAAALDLTAQQVRVLPDPAAENAGDFDLIIYSSNPWNIPPSVAPFVSRPEQQNVWRGVHFGLDIDQRDVVLPLIGKSMLIGGLPEMGKTTTGLGLLSCLAQDPYVRLWIADAKGVDTAPLIPLAYRYIGASQDEMIEMLDELEAWGRRKLAALKDVGRVKYEEDLCQMYRQIDPNHPLGVIDVVYIDEARFYTNGNVQIQSNKIVSRISRIIEMFRAVGIVVVIATQRPTAKNIPSEIRDLLRIRLAHACTTPTMSNTILGEGAAGLGYTASVFDEDYPGVAWLRVLKSFRQIRPHYTDLAALERCAKVAYEIREKTGTLPEQVDASLAASVPPVLSDIEAVMNENEWVKVPTSVLLPILSRLSPQWDGMSATDLSSALANWGVSPRPIGEWLFEDGRKSNNVRGYYLKHIQDGIARAKKKEVIL